MDAPLAISQEVGPCELHAAHSPITIVNERHHIFPVYLQKRVWGEERVNTRANICSTGHNTVHYAIDYYFKHGSWPANVVGKTRDLAQRAVALYEEARLANNQAV